MEGMVRPWGWQMPDLTYPVGPRPRFGEKEAYMGFMSSFLENHGPAMQRFLDQVAMVDVDAAPSGYQGSSDLALQLAVLHAQLCTIFAELDQVCPEPRDQNMG